MSATLAIVPASGSVISTKSATKVTVAGAPANTLTGYSPTLGPDGQPLQYPSKPEVRYYLTFELASAILGKSNIFGVDSTGGYEFNNYIFPAAGSWTVRLNDAADASSVATLAVTVS